MSSTLWLSDAELRDATGRKYPACQAKVLEGWRVPFQRRPDGSLLVGRAAMEAALLRSTMAPGQQPQPANGLTF